jgi:hypothetical protein
MAGPTVGFSHAAAMAACGPADEPAIQIFFSSKEVTSQPATPYISIFIEQQAAALVGRTLNLAGPTAEGSAWFRPNADETLEPQSGSLTVNSVGPDNSIQGTVDLTFPNATSVHGGFNAKWVFNQVFCI